MGAVYGRLDSGTCWAGRYDTQDRYDQWIQVDLGELQAVSGIIMQGRANYNQWVTEYQVEYSTDGSTWQYVQDENGEDMVSKHTPIRSTP